MLRKLISNSLLAVKTLVTRRLRIYSDRIPYTFDNLSLKKIFNASLAEASTIFKPEQSWGFPTHLMVEPSALCNLKCTLCPTTAGLERPAGNMELETFKKIIDETGDYIFTLLLWDWGEPFLNPDIYNMISYAKKKDIKIISSTNGHFFGDMEKADMLIKSGLDTIIFAMEGITQETYERYRQGGRIESVLHGIRNIAERKKALGSDTPFICLRFIVMGHNEHEIPQLKELAKSVGVNALTLKTLNPYSQDPYVGYESESRESFHEYLPKNTRYHRFKYDPAGLDRIRLRKNPCKHLWNNPAIHWSGKICPCTYDPNEKYVLGDLKKESFREVWNGDKYREMRRQFRTDWEKIGFCRECSYAYKGGNCSRETMADIFFFDKNSSDDNLPGTMK